VRFLNFLQKDVQFAEDSFYFLKVKEKVMMGVRVMLNEN